jgi:hypothetical protein
MNSSEAITFWGELETWETNDPENPLKSMALSNAACLRIRIQILNCSSPFIVKLKYFTYYDSEVFRCLPLRHSPF